jgi:alpha-tubulin suppressor-like RCC1 family protein
MVRDKVFASLSIEPSPVGPFNNLYSWGGPNTWGAIGNGTSVNKVEPNQIGAGTDWEDIENGSETSFAIKTDGTLWAWGSNAQAQLGLAGGSRSSPVQVGVLSDWSQVSAGTDYTLAVKTDGTLWAWGSATFGRMGNGTATGFLTAPTQIGALSDWSQVSAGTSNSLALKTNGTLWAWGLNSSGQLGDGTVVSKSSPVQIGALSDWAQVAGGSAFSLAIKTDGTIWAWGANSTGALGDGTTVSKSSPVQIGALSDWSQVAAGTSHSHAIKTNGTLWAWGDGTLGALGDNTTANKNSPVQIGVLSNWSQVSAGDISSAAVKTDGTLWAWGRAICGDGTLVSRSSPVQIGSLSDWVQVSAGYGGTGETYAFYLARRTGKTLYSWGLGASGQLGFSQGSYSSPIQIGSAEWDQVSYGLNFTAAIKTDNSLWVWGLGSYGQLGNDRVVDAVSVPYQIGALTDWEQVSAGGTQNTQFCIAVKTDGTLWAWGAGANGRLGDGTVVNRSSPVQIGALSDWAQVSAGDQHALAIKTNGTLWAWGAGASGQLGDGTVVSRSSPVQIGALSDWAQVASGGLISAAVKTNGTLWAWGRNNEGALGNDTVVSRSSPVQIGSLSDWAQVSAGSQYCLAIKTNGTLWAWGFNSSWGNLGDGTRVDRSSPVQVGALSNWSKVTASLFSYSLAVKTNGTLWAWGRGADGALGIGSTTNRSSPVQIGSLTDWGNTPNSTNQSTAGALSA